MSALGAFSFIFPHRSVCPTSEIEISQHPSWRVARGVVLYPMFTLLIVAGPAHPRLAGQRFIIHLLSQVGKIFLLFFKFISRVPWCLCTLYPVFSPSLLQRCETVVGLQAKNIIAVLKMSENFFMKLTTVVSFKKPGDSLPVLHKPAIDPELELGSSSS